MEKIYLSNSDGIPQFGCTKCHNCNSIFGKSLCKIKNRGCCWYYPKFTLFEIHKMVKTEEGLNTLNNIIKMPNTDVYNYYIHSKGFIDETSYEKYVNSFGTSRLPFATDEEVEEIRQEIIFENEAYELYEEYNENNLVDKKHLRKPRVIKDVSMFFRACPFVIENKGCTLDSKYRSYICNFFICDEIIDNLNDNSTFNKYIKERDNYIRWIEWENSSLQSLLKQNNINLINNFNAVIDLLQKLDISDYEFPSLDDIYLK